MANTQESRYDLYVYLIFFVSSQQLRIALVFLVPNMIYKCPTFVKVLLRLEEIVMKVIDGNAVSRDKTIGLKKCNFAVELMNF